MTSASAPPSSLLKAVVAATPLAAVPIDEAAPLATLCARFGPMSPGRGEPPVAV